MDQKINILLWAIGGGFAGTWYAMWKLFMRLEDRITKKIDSLDEKVTDVDRRFCRLEEAFSFN